MINVARIRAVTLMAGVLLSTALLATSCSKSPEERLAEAAVERASGRDVDIERDGKQVTIKADEGEMKMSAGEALPLPADFPRDVYLPDSYKVATVMDMGPMKAINLTTGAKVSTLFAEAGPAMKAQGWTQKMAIQQASGHAMLSFEKDKRSVSLSFTESRSVDGQTVVSLQLQQPQQ
ncbi:MAG: hypothetical protein ABIO38_03040 [Luteimonas sp.]